MRKRIDVHTHIVPPFWADAMQGRSSRNPNNYPLPPWSPDAAKALMDKLEIETGILSLTTPGVSRWPADERRPASRRVNEYTAEVGAQSPGRFGSFATLPLPDMDGALTEIAYAFDELKADGVVLYSNYDGVYLGDTSFEPLWAELDRRSALVFVHPGILPLDELAGTPAAFVDFPFDTTRTAVNIVLMGVFDRHKNVKVILSHGGGFLPYQAYRFAGCASAMGLEAQDDVIAKFRRFYYDTALASSSSTLPSLKAFADPTHLLFGTDYPYAPGNMAHDFTAMLDRSQLLDDSQRTAIDRNNTCLLLPKWA